jgi:hypothetical protein
MAMTSTKILQKLYFSQDEHYFSESQDTLIEIRAMVPTHAGNAANKLLDEAHVWADEAGVESVWPRVWITTTPLFRALAQRARANH